MSTDFLTPELLNPKFWLNQQLYIPKDYLESSASLYFRDYYGDVFVNNTLTFSDFLTKDFKELKPQPEYQNLAGEWDAFAHTFTSSYIAKHLGDHVSQWAGDLNEFRLNNSGASKNQDLWNNAKGREIVEKLGRDASIKEIADGIYNALKNGELIINKNNDPRKYEGTSSVVRFFDDIKTISSYISSIFDDIRDSINALKDPLIIDLKNDGLNLSDPNNRYIEPIYFDLNNDGIKEKTGWIIPKYEVINITDGISNGFITNPFYFEGDKEQSQQGWNISYSNITYNGIKQLINPVIDDAFLAIDKIMPQNETITESTLIN